MFLKVGHASCVVFRQDFPVKETLNGEWRNGIPCFLAYHQQYSINVVYNFPCICYSITAGKVLTGVISGFQAMHVYITFARFYQISFQMVRSNLYLHFHNHSHDSTSLLILDII